MHGTFEIQGTKSTSLCNYPPPPPPPPNPAYTRLWIGSPLVQILAYRLFEVKPLSRSMLGYCQLDTYKQILVKY